MPTALICTLHSLHSPKERPALLLQAFCRQDADEHRNTATSFAQSLKKVNGGKRL
jgi:hypothetical protein